MHPQGYWISGHDSRRRRWLLHWAVYDSQLNVPILYLMDVDDTGRRALTEDPKRWPEVRAHLLARRFGSADSQRRLGQLAACFDSFGALRRDGRLSYSRQPLPLSGFWRRSACLPTASTEANIWSYHTGHSSGRLV